MGLGLIVLDLTKEENGVELKINSNKPKVFSLMVDHTFLISIMDRIWRASINLDSTIP